MRLALRSNERLEIEFELAAVDRLAQVRLDLTARLARSFKCGLEAVDAAAFVLGAIEGEVGIAAAACRREFVALGEETRYRCWRPARDFMAVDDQRLLDRG